MTIVIYISGITGKVGSRLAQMIAQEPGFKLFGGYSKSKGEILNSSKLDAYDLIIDFSSKEGLYSILQKALAAKKPLVTGTTGLKDAEIDYLKECSKTIPILHSNNFSPGIALLREAMQKIALLFPAEIEIEEKHHIHKKDSPSGTALILKKDLEKTGKNDINIKSIREGEIIGEHKVLFSGKEEKIILEHIATSRDLFCRGALLAAKFLYGKKPKLYSFQEVFTSAIL